MYSARVLCLVTFSLPAVFFKTDGTFYAGGKIFKYDIKSKAVTQQIGSLPHAMTSHVSAIMVLPQLL